MSDKQNSDAANVPIPSELNDGDLDQVAGGAARKSPPKPSDPEEGGEFR